MTGADYSEARPGGAVLADAGITSVGRYLGTSTDLRALSTAEYGDLTGHGISVWLIREADGQEMLGGRAAGQQQAQTAQAAITRLGLPADSVVYFTADFDVQASQWTPCDDYLRGVNDVFQNVNRIGLYAGLRYINHVQSWGGAAWWWQAGASSWSTGGNSNGIHLEQLVGTAAGVSGTDADTIHQDNHGQIGADMTPLEMLTASFDSGQKNPDGTPRIVQVWQALQAIFFYGDHLNAQNVATQASLGALGQGAALTPEQLDTLSTQIVAKLPTSQAATKADVEAALAALTLTAGGAK